ncbi:MAG: glycoside hydrolase family 92 protein [Flavobacteriales bacterium]|nr:glycoside hydrolase family 92 protein [Flavobacteriales bacterium]
MTNFPVHSASPAPLREGIAFLSLLLPAALFAQTPNPARELVNPFIGTGGHGHTFPGACVPNGMVQLSPDTRPDGYMDWDGCGGYHYSDSLIYGFSHTHLSGTGVADLCDVLVMPMPGLASTEPEKYRSSFSHADEAASTGYYRVDLANGVKAELTASSRAGMHRYDFPANLEANIIIDLRHRDYLNASSIMRVGDHEVVGERRSSSWAKDQRLFFCMRISKPLLPREGQGTIADQIDATQREVDILSFGDLNGEPLVVKVGISAVSIEGARANLEAEVPHWDFDRVRKQAEEAWNTKLNKVQVKGGTKEQQRAYYTALYHCYVAPYIFNDADGSYRGMDGQVHKADHDVYTVFSLWDTFRALHPLMTVLEPEMTRDWIRTFLLHYQQGGRLPVWELWGNETDCMIGYHSVSVIADAYAKGIRDFDAKLALEAMVASAEADHFGLKAYRERGYISSEDEPESVSRTLEYAYDDWCIARFAEMIGEKDVAQRFYALSRNWQNLFDPETRFFRARRNGGFTQPFDPYEVNFHFTEANAWQYAFFVPHDMDRFTALSGGPSGLAQRLDALFTAKKSTTGRDQSDITGLIGQYAHGNEPSHNFAYLYNLSDRPLSTDVFARRIMQEFYTDAPDGLIGNEDCGQMSAWLVWSALGLYPICPGDPKYTIGWPLFDEATIDLGDGKRWHMSTEILGKDRSHVESFTWNGQETKSYRTLTHDELMRGGELRFTLGPRAGGSPGRFIQETADDWTPVPIIQAERQSFTDSLLVAISSSDDRARIEYTIDNGEPVRYEAPFWIRNSCTVTATALVPGTQGRKNLIGSKPVTARYNKYEGGRTIKLESTYANQYAAGGNNALIDGVRGGTDFRTGEWQGYRDQDVVAMIDLGKVMKLKRVGLSALQDQKSWVWLPSEVTISVSANQRQWSSATITPDVDRQQEGGITRELWRELGGRRARWIAITAKNAGPCPDWHPGKGGSSWIFLDEVLIETQP